MLIPIPPVPLRSLCNVVAALALAITSLRAAPYGPDGMAVEWMQPDGEKLSLRVFGDEFHAHTETLDGLTVVYNPTDNAYHYAILSSDGRKLLPSGHRVNGKPPVALAKHLRLPPEARQAIWKERYQKMVPNERANWAKRVQAARQRKGLDPEVPAPAPDGGEGPVSDGPPPSFAPVTGGYVGLTILVQFPDDPATTLSFDPTNFPTTKTEIENYCNQIGYTGGGNTGSVRDYFLAQSNNQADYTQFVTEIVTLPQPRAYYNWSNYPTNTILRDVGSAGRLILSNAITILRNQGFNFSGLTRDSSNRIVATNVLFAGATSGVWSYGLWPHRWYMSPQINCGTASNPIYVYDYQITNAQTASVPIGTFCHENGHLLLKYPDLYDYGGDSEGVGNHCLMGTGGHLNGGRTPAPINGYFKDVSGWSNVLDITSSQVFTDVLSSTNNEGYRIRKSGAPTEYFLIENRGGGDPWTQYSPDKGIVIWHIDESVNGNDNQQMTASQHYEVSLEQADGAFDLESDRNGGDNKDLFDNTTQGFGDTTVPNAQWWDGSNSGIQIGVLSAPEASMDVRFGLPPNTISMSTPNGGEQVYFGSTREIRWASNTSGNVKIELYKGGIPHSVLSPSEPNDGNYSWLVSTSLPAGNNYTIRISSLANPAYVDSSDSTFSIQIQPTLAEALDATGFTWTSVSSQKWFAQSSTTYDGIDAVQSGAIAHSRSTFMETTINGPGILAFQWKVSSEIDGDYLRFYLDGTEQTGSLARISGSVDWTPKSVTIPAGVHTVKWGYTKNAMVAAEDDAAWVDQVVYTPISTSEIEVEQPAGSSLTDGIASVDCGVFNLTSSSQPIVFTVKNTGVMNLTGLSLSKDGSHSGDFTLGGLGATTLVPGASTTFTVIFSPGGEGSRNATIHIASNDADESPFDIALTGTGVTLGTLVVMPAGSTTFSGTYGGPFFPASRQFTLSNPGLTPIEWTAAKTAEWMDLDATSGTLAPGSNTLVTVSTNSAANSLALGTYTETTAFTNTTNGNGSTTRVVALTVDPIPATITLGDLNHTYDGVFKAASITTNPPGLAYSVTYNGSPQPPVNVGTYSVSASITTPNFDGSDTKDMVIHKAAQTINFAALDPVLADAAPLALTATATSGLPVSYASNNTSIATVSGNTVTIVGPGDVTIRAYQSGNGNYTAAPMVWQTLTVRPSSPVAAPGGPYKISVSQSLLLNGGNSQPSYGETITNYEWDLNRDNVFGDATGPTPSAISAVTLTSTWGMSSGAVNPIKLKVTDSAGKTSVNSTSVVFFFSLTWDANGSTAGQTNGAGTWFGADLWWDGTANQTWRLGSAATFGGPNTFGGAVAITSSLSVNSFTFNTFAGIYTIGSSGQTITLEDGINKNAGSGTVLFVSPITLAGNQTWTNNSTREITAGNGMNLIDTSWHQLTLGGTGSFHFNANNDTENTLIGYGSLIKEGSGNLVLRGLNNEFYGNIKVTGGSIISGVPGSLGMGNLRLEGGVHEARSGSHFTRGLGSGGGEVQIPGGASGFAANGNTSTTVILGNNAGSEAVWGAANEAGNTNALGYFNPSTLVLQSTNTLFGPLDFRNRIDLNGTTRNIQVSTSTATISGIIRTSSGMAGIMKTGNGRLTLSAANTYNGGTTIGTGALRVSNSSALGSTDGNTTIAATGLANSARLELGSSITSPEDITITGTTETGAFVPAISNFDGSNTLSGNITLSSPTGGVRLGASTGTLTFSGVISQTTTAEPLIFITGNGGSITVNNPIANNGGALEIVNVTQTTGTGVVVLKGVSGGGLGGTHVRQTGILRLGVADALNPSANLTLGAVATTAGHDVGTFDLAGFDQTINALIGNRNTSNFSANSSRKVTNSATGTGTNVLTVGNGDGSGVFDGVIVDGATGKVALTKVGNGIQTLTGPNAYTGATTVSGGTLALGASDTLANTTVVSIGNATLAVGAGCTDTAGLLNVTGTATINLGADSSLVFANSNGTWSGTLNITGSFVPGSSLRFGNSNTALSSAQLARISASGYGPLILDANGFLTVDTTPPTIVSISDDKSGGPLTVNTLVTYTVTFSEDMDASTVNDADFGNAGSAIVTIGSASESQPGVFIVQATPTTVGTLQLQINAAATMKDVAGNNLVTSSSNPDDTVLTVRSPYESWASAKGLVGHDALAGSNPDNDMLVNLLEYAFGTDPAASTSGPITYVPGGDVTNLGSPVSLNFATDGTMDFRAVFGRRKDYQEVGLHYTVQFSDGLGVWVDSGVEPSVLTGENSTGDMEAVSVSFPSTIPVGEDFKKPTFFRVGVSSDGPP